MSREETEAEEDLEEVGCERKPEGCFQPGRCTLLIKLIVGVGMISTR